MSLRIINILLLLVFVSKYLTAFLYPAILMKLEIRKLDNGTGSRSSGFIGQ